MKFKELKVGQYFRVVRYEECDIFLKTANSEMSNCFHLNSFYSDNHTIHETEEVKQLKLNELVMSEEI